MTDIAISVASAAFIIGVIIGVFIGIIASLIMAGDPNYKELDY